MSHAGRDQQANGGGPKPRLSATLALIGCALGISASASLNKLAMAAGLHPIWLNVLRLGITVAVMLPFFLRRRDAGNALRALCRRDWRLLLLSGAMLALHFAAWVASLALADSFVAVTIWSTFSLMTVVGSSLLLRERTPLVAQLGLILAVVGVGVSAVGASRSQLLGVVMALVAAASQAIYTLCGRSLRRKLDTLPYTMVVYTLAFVCLLAAALTFRLPTDGMNAQGIGACAALALVCTLGGHSLQSYALRYYKAPTVSAVALTEVITGPLLVYVFFAQAPGTASLIGGAIILLGVGWYLYSEWRQAGKAKMTEAQPSAGE